MAQPRVVYVEYVEWVLCNQHVPQNNGPCCLSQTPHVSVWLRQGLFTGNTPGWLGGINNMCQAAMCCVVCFICSSVHLVQELYCYKQLSCLVAECVRIDFLGSIECVVLHY